MSESNNSKSVLESTAVVLGTNVLGAILGFATGALVARGLDVEKFGDFSLILAIFSIILLFSGLGVGFEVSRLIANFRAAKDPKKVASIMKSAAGTTIVTTCLLALLLFASADFIAGIFHKDIAQGLRISSPMVIFAGFMAIFLAFMQGFQRFFSHSILVSFNNIIKLAAVALLIGFGIIGALSGILAAYILTFIVGIFLLHRVTAFYRVKAYDSKAILAGGIPFFAFSLFVFLGGRASMYLLGLFSGSTELGLYSGALMFSQAFFMLPDAIATVLLPALSGMYQRDDRFSAFLAYSLKLGSLAAFPILLYAGILAPHILWVLLGKSYVQSAAILRIMVLTGVAYFFYSLLSTTIASSGHQKTLVAVSLTGFVAILASGLFLIPRYGVYGAAFADAIGYFLMAAVALVVARKFVRCNLPAGLDRVALANLLFGAALWYGIGVTSSFLGLAIVSGLSAALYVVSIKIFGAISPEESAVLNNLFQQYLRKKTAPSATPSGSGFYAAP